MHFQEWPVGGTGQRTDIVVGSGLGCDGVRGEGKEE